jgi:hypothetical protein
MVEAHHALRADRVERLDLDARRLGEDRREIGRHLLVIVHFARDQSVHAGGRVWDVEPLDAINLGDLGPGCARGRLLARHVVLELLVHHLGAGHPLLLAEDKRTGSDRALDLLERIGLGDRLRHDEGNVGGDLRDRVDQEAVGPGQLDLQRLGVAAAHALDRREHQLAHGVALAPADQRGGTVFRSDRLAVVEAQSVTQHESPGLAVGRGLPLVDHLRLGLEVLVHRKQRVVDHVAVIAADIGGGPDRIDVLQVGVRNDAQGRAAGLPEAGAGQERRRKRAADEGTTREMHGTPPARTGAMSVQMDVVNTTSMSQDV